MKLKILRDQISSFCPSEHYLACDLQKRKKEVLQDSMVHVHAFVRNILYCHMDSTSSLPCKTCDRHVLAILYNDVVHNKYMYIYVYL